MKHLKSFNESFGVTFLATLGVLTVIDIIKQNSSREKIFNELSSGGLDQIANLVKKHKNKSLIGRIIDNEEYVQIIYKCDADNIIHLQLDKPIKKLTFRWDFEIPILPYVKHSKSDGIEIDLEDDEYAKILQIIEDIKGENFDNEEKIYN